ncbi:MAG: TorD/DmsD family molecular chaperone [Halanaeroarchaeum sp.]
MAAETPFDRSDDWAATFAVLADCVRKPDEALVEDVEDGHLHAAMEDLTADLDLQPANGTMPPEIGSVGDATESYLGLFEAMRKPFAPLAESPYKPWYGEREGLMGGPPAKDMLRRYESVEAEFPAGYPPDHLALEFEYASLLFESNAEVETERFVAHHLDWIPALRATVDDAVAEAPFYRWAIAVADEITVALRSRLDVDPVSERDIEEMTSRVDAGRSARQFP